MRAGVEEKHLNENIDSQTMVKILKALANPIRLKMIAILQEEPKNIYALSKELGLPYPLAHLHLNGLKKLRLVKEVRTEQKAKGLPSVKYYAPSEFQLILTPDNIRKLYAKTRRKK
jgi:DNA-binding transcriptional ArsR family regulator